MREQDVIASLSGEAGEPLRLWLVIPGMNRSADAADAFLMWVAVGAAGFGTETSVVRNISTGQANQNHFLAVHSDGLPLIIQHSHASGRQEPEVLLIHHPLVIAE